MLPQAPAAAQPQSAAQVDAFSPQSQAPLPQEFPQPSTTR
jgi:hypothetical protein